MMRPKLHDYIYIIYIYIKLDPVFALQVWLFGVSTLNFGGTMSLKDGFFAIHHLLWAYQMMDLSTFFRYA